MKIETFKRGPARFDMCGQFKGYPILELEPDISPGLAMRLLAYATRRVKETGLDFILKWEVTIGTDSGDEKPADRDYWVSWKNPQGAEITLQRILTNNGWPFLDHRFDFTGQ